MANGEFLSCPAPRDLTVLVKSRCGGPGFFDRDCVRDDRKNPLRCSICGAKAWVRKHPARFVEFWEERGTVRLFTMRHKEWSVENILACQGSCSPGQWIGDPSLGPEDVFTIGIPGVTDFLKLPGLESPELRRARAQRLRDANPTLPVPLRWIPKVLNILDDAQDLLFTGLALLYPILRRLPRGLLGPLGILLTLNDLLNLFT